MSHNASEVFNESGNPSVYDESFNHSNFKDYICKDVELNEARKFIHEKISKNLNANSSKKTESGRFHNQYNKPSKLCDQRNGKRAVYAGGNSAEDIAKTSKNVTNKNGSNPNGMNKGFKNFHMHACNNNVYAEYPKCGNFENAMNVPNDFKRYNDKLMNGNEMNLNEMNGMMDQYVIDKNNNFGKPDAFPDMNGNMNVNKKAYDRFSNNNGNPMIGDSNKSKPYRNMDKNCIAKHNFDNRRGSMNCYEPSSSGSNNNINNNNNHELKNSYNNWGGKPQENMGECQTMLMNEFNMAPCPYGMNNQNKVMDQNVNGLGNTYTPGMNMYNKGRSGKIDGNALKMNANSGFHVDHPTGKMHNGNINSANTLDNDNNNVHVNRTVNLYNDPHKGDHVEKQQGNGGEHKNNRSGSSGHPEKEEENIIKLFFGNLAPITTEKDMYNLFTPYGRCSSLIILKDRRSKSRGSGFVTFYDQNEAINAIKCLNNKITLPGAHKPLEVRFPEDKSERQLRTKLLSVAKCKGEKIPPSGCLLIDTEDVLIKKTSNGQLLNNWNNYNENRANTHAKNDNSLCDTNSISTNISSVMNTSINTNAVDSVNNGINKGLTTNNMNMNVSTNSNATTATNSSTNIATNNAITNCANMSNSTNINNNNNKNHSNNHNNNHNSNTRHASNNNNCGRNVSGTRGSDVSNGNFFNSTDYLFESNKPVIDNTNVGPLNNTNFYGGMKTEELMYPDMSHNMEKENGDDKNIILSNEECGILLPKFLIDTISGKKDCFDNSVGDTTKYDMVSSENKNQRNNFLPMEVNGLGATMEERSQEQFLEEDNNNRNSCNVLATANNTKNNRHSRNGVVGNNNNDIKNSSNNMLSPIIGKNNYEMDDSSFFSYFTMNTKDDKANESFKFLSSALDVKNSIHDCNDLCQYDLFDTTDSNDYSAKCPLKNDLTNMNRPGSNVNCTRKNSFKYDKYDIFNAHDLGFNLFNIINKNEDGGMDNTKLKAMKKNDTENGNDGAHMNPDNNMSISKMNSLHSVSTNEGNASSNNHASSNEKNIDKRRNKTDFNKVEDTSADMHMPQNYNAYATLNVIERICDGRVHASNTGAGNYNMKVDNNNAIDDMLKNIINLYTKNKSSIFTSHMCKYLSNVLCEINNSLEVFDECNAKNTINGMSKGGEVTNGRQFS